MERLSWNEYFMKITQVVAERSTCLRRKVGAVIVKEKRILATGYNGAVTGLAHCEDAGCLREELKVPAGQRQEICRGLHAEANALLFAAVEGTNMEGAVIYCTHQPCILCAKMIIQSGIRRVIFGGEYPDKLALDMFKEANVELCQTS
ncbi:dCMP deaminase family protein [bacterium]|nr:dCMP deaminase family protein [bacterium]